MQSQKLINLQQGAPSPRLIPTNAISEATQALLAQPGVAQRLMYGPDAGEDYIRANIARWLTDFYQPEAGSITPERLAITNGASNALSTILQVCTDPAYTQALWIVEPTYFLARKIWLDAGFGGKMHAVPDGEDGIDLAFLRQRLEEMDSAASRDTSIPFKNNDALFPKLYKHVLYMVPTNSNPTGHTMSHETRLEVVKLARQFDMLVIADDVYDFLRWPKQEHLPLHVLGLSPPRLVDIDRLLNGGNPFGNVVSNGSFSKVITPGLRVGWVEGTPAFIKILETAGGTQSGGCQSQFASMVVDLMLSSGQVTKQLEEVLIPTFRKRYHSMVCAIRHHLYPLGVRILHDEINPTSNPPASVPQAGGYVLYITFPDDGRFPDVADIARAALEVYQLQIGPGPLFEVKESDGSKNSQGQYRQGARLCWAWHEEELIVEGIARLAKVLAVLQTSTGK